MNEQIKHITRKTEESFARLFSTQEKIAPGITRRSDPALPDMHDHNNFGYERPLTDSDIRLMQDYQRSRGDSFLKIEGDFPLDDKLVKRANLESGCTLTMAANTNVLPSWKTNPAVEIRKLSEAANSDDILNLELKNYGSIYGEDFAKRKMQRYFSVAAENKNLEFICAYIDGQITGYLYSYHTDECIMLDSLIVNEEFRMQKIATTLIRASIGDFKGIAFLHADSDDTPKEMYLKMGFQTVDHLYEYQKTQGDGSSVSPSL